MRLVVVALSVLLIVGLAAAAPAPATPAVWLSSSISTAEGAEGPSLAIDAQGTAHVAYHTEDGLQYATESPSPTSSWVVEGVGAGLGVGPRGLALDATGAPRVAAMLQTGSYTHALAYLARGNAGWTQQVVDANGDTGWAPALALDSAGEPHAAYLAASGSLRQVRVADHDAAGWHVAALTGWGYYDFPDLAVDGAGVPHAAWGGNGVGLWYATRGPAGWSAAQIDPVNGAGASLAFDGATPHLAAQALSATGWTLQHMTLAGAAWTREDLGILNEGYGILAVGADHQPRIAFWQASSASQDAATTWQLQLATRHAAGTWSVEATDDGLPTMPPTAVISEPEGASLAFDGGGMPVIAAGYVTTTPQPVSLLTPAETWHVDLVTKAL